MYLHRNLKLYQISELISAFCLSLALKQRNRSGDEKLFETHLNSDGDQVLTVDADFNPFADARWNVVLRDAQIGAHVQARDARYLQHVGVPFGDFKRRRRSLIEFSGNWKRKSLILIRNSSSHRLMIYWYWFSSCRRASTWWLAVASRALDILMWCSSLREQWHHSSWDCRRCSVGLNNRREKKID